jgi:hypothetical protein
MVSGEMRCRCGGHGGGGFEVWGGSLRKGLRTCIQLDE